MFEDLIKGVREYISDRFMSPLGAALATSWCGWNYKFLLIVFSGEPVIRKFHLIRMVYHDSSWWVLLLGPALTAAIYLFAFPFPSKWVYAFTLRRRREALDTLREIEKQTPLTKEESEALRDRFTQIETDHLSEKLRLNTALDSFKDQLRIALEGKQAAEEELLRVQRATDGSPSSDNVPDGQGGSPVSPVEAASEAATEAGGEASTVDAPQDAHASQDEPTPQDTRRASLPLFTPTHSKVMRAIGGQTVPPSAVELARSIGLQLNVVELIVEDLISRQMIESAQVPYPDGRAPKVGYRATKVGLRYLLSRGG